MSEERADAPEEQAAGELELILLGAAPTLSREAVEAASHLPVEQIRRLWRALGFPDTEPGVPAYTEADVTALGHTQRLIAEGWVDARSAEAFARVLGQSLSHLAETQLGLVADRLTATGAMEQLRADPEAAVRTALGQSLHVIDEVEQLMVYVWRRHLVAAAHRELSALSSDSSQAPLAVGFADVVGYTTLTRDMTTAELEQLVETFERGAYDAVVTRGGRIVKTLGDEVMFVTQDPHSAAEAALALAESFGLDKGPVPPLRVGLAWGPALSRGGDVFGPVVNVASRCCGLARPATVLVDREMAAVLKDDSAYDVRPLRPRAVRGYGRLLASTLRRARQR